MSGTTIDNERFRRLLASYPKKAISFLYEWYYHKLVEFSCRHTSDLQASEDIVQETFLLIWQKHRWLGEYNESSIKYYLYKVVRNKSISFYKRTQRLYENKKQFESQALPRVEESIESRLMGVEIQHEIRQVITAFPRREKECLLMKIDDNMSVEQIAFTLRISRKAVERSLTSANKRLRRYGAFIV